LDQMTKIKQPTICMPELTSQFDIIKNKYFIISHVTYLILHDHAVI
jgi:hypothetical protein